MHGEAAIDGDRDSRDERSFIGHEESHGVGDILGLPWARDEGVTQQGTLHLCGNGGRHRGGEDDSWRDGHRADALPSVLDDMALHISFVVIA